MTGTISLDFANTAGWHSGPDPEEHLTSYEKAVEWAKGQGVLTCTQADRLLARARDSTDSEANALRRIIALREALYHIFSAVAHRRPAALRDLDILNAELAGALPHLRLVPAKQATPDDKKPSTDPRSVDLPSFDWTWVDVEEDLTSMLWPVARASASLLASPQLAQVRECAGDPCGWLFLDLSRNGSRRWCDMADCGNRAKARRYRARKKESLAAGQAEAAS